MPGEYYGYYDETGKWVTGQHSPNKPTKEQLIQINQTLAEMKLFSKAWFKGIGRDLLIVVGIKGLPALKD
jgi:hypothetical protein